MSMRHLLMLGLLWSVACNAPRPTTPPQSPDDWHLPQPPPEPTRLDRDVSAERVDPIKGAPRPGDRPAAYPWNVVYRPAHRLRVIAYSAKIAASPSGDVIVVASGVPDDLVVIRDLVDASQDLTLHFGMANVRPGGLWRGYRPQEVAWCTSPSPMLVVAGERALWAIDPSSWTTLPGFPIALSTAIISALECLPDGAIAVGEGSGGTDTGKGNLTVIERTGKIRLSVLVHNVYPSALAVTRTGAVATESPTGVALWDPKTGQQIASRVVKPGADNRAFEVDGLMVASPAADELALVIHDFGTFVPYVASIPSLEPRMIPAVRALRDNDAARHSHLPPLGYVLAMGRTYALAYSPDGRTLVVAGQENEKVWAGNTWDRNVLWVLRDGALIDTLVSHSTHIHDVLVLADGRILSIDDRPGGAELIVWERRR